MISLPTSSVLVSSLLALLVIQALQCTAAAEAYVDGEKVNGEQPATKNPRKAQYKQLSAFLAKEVTLGLSLGKRVIDFEKKEYCKLPFLRCGTNGDIVGLDLKNVEGTLAMDSLPEKIVELSVTGGALNQPPVFDKIPPTLKRMVFRNVRFASGSATLTVRRRHSRLRTLVCNGCGLSKVQWSTIPPITSLDLSGNPDLSVTSVGKLPRTLLHLNLSHCGLDLAVNDLTALPDGLLSLNMSHNRLTGSFLEQAPLPDVEVLDLGHNQLTGALQDTWKVFPGTLLTLSLTHNGFTGSLGDLKSFNVLESLDVSRNNLATLQWTKMPESLRMLNASFNKIQLEHDFTPLPPSLEDLDMKHNLLSGNLDLKALPKRLVSLDVSENHFSGEVDFDHLNSGIQYVIVDNNKLNGPWPDLTNLPASVRKVSVKGNPFSLQLPPETDL